MNDPRRDLAAYGRRLHEKGFVAATDGNLSVRAPGGGFFATPTGLPKGELSEGVIVALDASGRPTKGAPSSEWPMHFAIYEARPDVGAVVHAHPPFATALACAGRGMEKPILAEAVMSLGAVPLSPFHLPSTSDLARSVAGALGAHSAVLLGNHGAVTVGSDIRTAYYRMETLEHAARVQLYTDLLGGGKDLPTAAVEALKGLGQGYALAPLPAPACAACPVAAGEEGAVVLRRDELARLLIEFSRVYPGGGSR